jgi:glutathione S-transferase
LILIGMFDSPFVRRVAVSMKLLGIAFEHRNWSVGRDFDAIRKFNPLGRVPTLVLDDGEVLIDSSAILDYIDGSTGPERALVPAAGGDRRATLRVMAIATGAAEKGREALYERVFRPAEKRYEPWIERCLTQMHGALAELDRLSAARGAGNWIVGNRLTQADVTATCMFTFLEEVLALTPERAPYPALRALASRCEALPQFSATREPYSVPNPRG